MHLAGYRRLHQPRRVDLYQEYPQPQRTLELSTHTANNHLARAAACPHPRVLQQPCLGRRVFGCVCTGRRGYSERVSQAQLGARIVNQTGRVVFSPSGRATLSTVCCLSAPRPPDPDRRKCWGRAGGVRHRLRGDRPMFPYPVCGCGNHPPQDQRSGELLGVMHRRIGAL